MNPNFSSSVLSVRYVQAIRQPGLWFSGQPHEVLYDSANGDVVVERVAANTLVWQEGDVLLRIEGFAELSDALHFAEGT